MAVPVRVWEIWLGVGLQTAGAGCRMGSAECRFLSAVGGLVALGLGLGLLVPIDAGIEPGAVMVESNAAMRITLELELDNWNCSTRAI